MFIILAWLRVYGLVHDHLMFLFDFHCQWIQSSQLHICERRWISAWLLFIVSVSIILAWLREYGLVHDHLRCSLLFIASWFSHHDVMFVRVDGRVYNHFYFSLLVRQSSWLYIQSSWLFVRWNDQAHYPFIRFCISSVVERM